MKMRAPKQLKLLVIATALALPVQAARAELISTDEVVSHSSIQEERDKVQAFLSRADAQQNLVTLGVNPELAKQRVDALTDAEVVNLAGKIDSLPAGGALSNHELILIVLIAILVAILI